MVVRHAKLSFVQLESTKLEFVSRKPLIYVANYYVKISSINNFGENAVLNMGTCYLSVKNANSLRKTNRVFKNKKIAFYSCVWHSNACPNGPLKYYMYISLL